MNTEVDLKALNSDFEAVCGKPFLHFFCPFLHRDESCPLIHGHVVNDAFEGSSGRTVLQRADMDGFFATYFEADFVKIRFLETHPTMNAIHDPKLAGQLQLRVMQDGKPVGHYRPKADAVPPHHTLIVVSDAEGRETTLVLKIEFCALQHPSEWQFVVEQDLQLPALVSLLKAAHLTLFAMLGHNYVFSAGGIFVGREVLGKFVAEHLNRSNKSGIIINAKEHFRRFRNLVRPVLHHVPELAGTVVDGNLYLCETSTGERWAFMIFVRTQSTRHAVLVPILHSAEGAARFHGLLDASESQRLIVRWCRFNGREFEAASGTTVFDWPTGKAHW